MAFLISTATLLLGLLLAAASAIGCIFVWAQQGGRAAQLLLGRCLVAGLPLFASMLFFCYAFLQDPLWPSQDAPKELQEAYVVQRAQVETLYTLDAVLGGVSLVWLVLRVAGSGQAKRWRSRSRD